MFLATPLTSTDGNRRKSSRVKPISSRKEKENTKQQENGVIVLEDELAEEPVNIINILENAAIEEILYWFKKDLKTRAIK